MRWNIIAFAYIAAADMRIDYGCCFAYCTVSKARQYGDLVSDSKLFVICTAVSRKAINHDLTWRFRRKLIRCGEKIPAE